MSRWIRWLAAVARTACRIVSIVSGSVARAGTSSSQPGSPTATNSAPTTTAITLAAAIHPGENGAFGTGGTPGRFRTTTFVVPSRVLTKGSAITSSNKMPSAVQARATSSDRASDRWCRNAPPTATSSSSRTLTK